MNSSENNNRAASQDFQTALGFLEERLRSLEDSESIINGLLQGAAEFYGAARASVVEADWDLKIGLLTYEWCAEGVEHQKDMLQYLAVEGFPRWCDFLSLNKPVVIPDMEAIKDTYPDEYQFFQHYGVKSVLAAPFSKRINQGFIAVLVIFSPSNVNFKRSAKVPLLFALNAGLSSISTLAPAGMVTSSAAMLLGRTVPLVVTVGSSFMSTPPPFVMVTGMNTVPVPTMGEPTETETFLASVTGVGGVVVAGGVVVSGSANAAGHMAMSSMAAVKSTIILRFIFVYLPVYCLFYFQPVRTAPQARRLWRAWAAG